MSRFRLSFNTVFNAIGWSFIGIAFNDNVLGAAKVYDHVDGETMPTSMYVLVNRLNNRLGRGTEMQKGDIVVVTSPFNPHVKLLSRIQCLQGEYVRWSYGEILPVPVGSCLLEGLGFVPLALLDGKAEAVLWPPKRSLNR